MDESFIATYSYKLGTGTRGAFHSFEKRTRFFLNKRILTDFSWIFLKNKRIFAKGVRDFWE